MDKRDKQQAEQMQLFRQQQTEQMQLFRQHLETRDTQHAEQIDSLRQQLHSEQKKNENNSQELVRVHQQVANLTKEINKVTQGLDDDIDYENLTDDELLNAYLANHGTGAVEEFKEGEQPDDELSTTSSSFSRDPTIAPCAAAGTSKFIQRTEGRAAKDPGAPAATSPATAAKVDKACKAPAATTQPTKRTPSKDTTMTDFFNPKRSASPPTATTNDKSALVPLKKKKSTKSKSKSGQTITKAAQGRS